MSKFYFEKVKEKRNELDITQKEMCEDLKIDLEKYKDIEKGLVKPSEREINTICEFLKLDVEDIFDKDFKETTVLSFVNNKGGCGKTSVSGSIAYALSELGFKVLCIDADMQGNLTHSLDIESNPTKNLARAIINEEDLQEHIIDTKYKNIDFVTYSPELSTIEMIMFNKHAREELLRRILKTTLKNGIYDFIVIDTNPTLSMLNFNVINITNYCIPPLQLGAFGLEGLHILLDFINNVKVYNPDFKDTKLVINNYDARKKEVTPKSEEWLRENYGHMLLDTIIRVDTNIEKAQLQGEPVLVSHKNSRISNEIRELTHEILKLIGKEDEINECK